ncbi:MAG: type II secretion system F family protein [Acidimicrobiia bacterium]|nr:type II secretion system F family protein [Acidimicrobiia bacterium]
MIDVGRTLVVSLLSGIAVVAIAWAVLRPPRRLAARLRPYLPGASAVDHPGDGDPLGGIAAVLRPIATALGAALAAVVDAEPEARTAERLLHAGIPGRGGAPLRVGEYRARQLRSTLVGAGFGWLLGSTLLPSGGWLALLGGIVGATRLRGRIDRAIEERRSRMRVEIYTVDQMLALRIRSGAGVLQSIEEYTSRASGEAADELREALRLARAGRPLPEALERIAARTAEPFCARTYRSLALAGERGADLAIVLLDLASEVRRDRRETLRRRAVKRRAAMLIPTIGLMAPVLLLFIAAPLPRIVLGSL